MKTQEEVKGLLVVVQDEKANGFARKHAMDDLLNDIIKFRMKRHLAKYSKSGTGIDVHDIEQTFLMATAEAIVHADPLIGDPMMFILQKGKWAVADMMRSFYRKRIRQYCHACGKETRLFEKKGRIATCPKCGNDNPETLEGVVVNQLDDGTTLNQVKSNALDLQDDVASSIIVNQFRDKLNGRTLEVFDLIMVEGFDRDSCTNYIKEIAAVLEVTSTNVNLRMRKIKAAWTEFADEIATGEVNE